MGESFPVSLSPPRLTREDGVRAPKEWRDSNDPRVVTGCWVEYCIVNDGIIAPAGRLLERPLPYEIPVPGELLSSTSAEEETSADRGEVNRRRESQDPYE